jgi:hypothetical protein
MTWADKMREAPPESLYEFVTTLGLLVDDRCALVEQQVEQFRELLNGTPADIEFIRHALEDSPAEAGAAQYAICGVIVHPRAYLAHRQLLIENARLRRELENDGSEKSA